MLAAALLCAGATAGCSATSFECTVELSSIRLAATVIDTGERVDAEAKLWARQRSGSEIPIALCQDDETDTLMVGGQELQPIQTTGHVVYRAQLEEARRRYQFEVYRSEEDAKATLEIPSPQGFALQLDTPTISRAAPPPITWAPPNVDGELVVTVERDELNCLQHFEAVVPDIGSATFAAPWPALAADAADQAECDAELSLVRRSDTSISDGLREGTTGSVFVQRRLRFVSVP